MKKLRNNQMDIFRGIAIIFVVLGHAAFPGIHFIYLFHLALFFFASGFFFKDKNIKNFESVKKYVISRFFRLYIPFFVSNAICIFCNNIFLDLKLYSLETHSYFSMFKMWKEIGRLFFMGGTQEMVGATWILPSFLIISVVYCFIDFILSKHFKNLEKEIIHIFVGCLLLITGYFFAQNQINLKFVNLTVFTCYFLFDLGKKISRLSFARKANFFSSFVLLVFSFSILLFLNNYGSIELSKNEYTNPFYFMIVSCLGCLFVYELSYFISKIKYLNHIFEKIGQKSMTVMIGHFAAFKVVNAMVVFACELSVDKISIFPVAFRGGLWWFIYTFFAIISVMLIENIFQNLFIKLKEKIYEIRRSNCNI